MKSRISFILAAGTAAASLLVAQAQAQDLDIGEIVVTPSRTPLDKSKVGSKVEKVDRETIEEQAKPLLTDYLSLLPGVAISSLGGPGSEGSLALRGAPRRYIKTLYNGIDISDPTNTQVQTSYQYLLADQVESIELLKGSQSTLYGSDAIAGVIGISTLGEIPLGVQHLLHGEGGSRGSLRGSYRLRTATERSKFALTLAGVRTDGISSAASGTEPDGYENITFDAAGEYRFSDVFSIFGSLLYLDSSAKYDNDFTTPPTDDLVNTNFTTQKAARLGFNLNMVDGRFRNTVSVQGVDLGRSIVSTGYTPAWRGNRTKVDYQGAFDVTERFGVQFGADHEIQRARYEDNFPSSITDETFNLTGIWALANLQPLDDLYLTAGLRHDQHSTYGGYTTYRGTGAWLLPSSGTRFHGSVGTGFRAPSLNELFYPFGGDATLQPETSFSADFGIEQTFLDGRLVADVTLFALDIDNVIRYIGGTYTQTQGTARSRGVETSLIYRVSNRLDIGASYTYTNAYAPDANGVYGRDVRVPRHAVGLSVSARPWEKWTLSADARIALDTVDISNVALDDYVLVNAKVAYQMNDNAEFYVRGENLLDQKYQTARGYSMPGLGVFAGFRAKFGP